MQIVFSLLAVAISVFTVTNSAAQDGQPISWSYQWNQTSDDEGMIVLTASLTPGWHLYSQHLEEGGPIPTQLNFTKRSDFELIGKPQEKGSAFTYYDSLYEMNITWYAYEVGFLQKVRLNKPSTTLECMVSFMVCNNNKCIPMKEEFVISIGDMRK